MGDQIRVPRVVIICLFSLFFRFLFPRQYWILQNCHPYVIWFLLFINFLFLVLPWPYLCVFICTIVYISSGTRRSNYHQFLSKHLISAWIFQNFTQLDAFVTFSVFFFFFGNRVRLNLYERALSCFLEMRLQYNYGELLFIKTFVQEFIQCRAFLR